MSQAVKDTSLFQELVTFYIEEDIFGVDVEQVVEVNRDLVWTPIPGANEAVCGAANLRGHIVTILDIRKVLKYGQRPENLVKTVIIVFWRDELVGILVDKIADVDQSERDKIELPPSNLPATQSKCLSGVLKKEGRLIGILNLDQALEIRQQV